MIKHYCDMCGAPIDDDNVYKMSITCRKVTRVGIRLDLDYCKKCMEAIIPEKIREEEAQKKAELAERVAARKEAARTKKEG